MAFNTLAIEEGDLTPANQEYISASLTAAEALLGIIVQILDASKFADEGAAQRLQLASAPFSIAKLAADLVDICGPKANRKDIEFVVARARGATRGPTSPPSTLRVVHVTSSLFSSN